MRSEDLDQDEAKYSPEEKSIVDKSDMDRTPTPSEESEDDEGKKEKHRFKKRVVFNLRSRIQEIKLISTFVHYYNFHFQMSNAVWLKEKSR